MSPQPARAVYDPFQDNPVLQRIFARMPAEVRATFTAEQVLALDRAAAAPSAAHRISLRRTVSLLGRRYYLAVFVGTDRRRPLNRLERFIVGGMKISATRRLLLGTLYVMIVTAVAIPLVLGLYLAKSLAGIDLMEGHSVFHAVFF